MDSHRNGARTRLKHYPFVTSQYRRDGPWVRDKERVWSCGGEKGGVYYGNTAQPLLGEMSCWDDIPPKRGKDELESLGAYHRS